ncbi:MAG: allophanate hydrolase [Acetobacteraceae bacterium]
MTPVEAADAAIAADYAHGDTAIWITRLPDEAIRERARALAAEGPQDRPLWGVPFAVKDNIDIAGLPTTAACPGYAYTPVMTAPAVQRLLDAGAVLIGKTNLDQFATGLVGTRSPYGVPRNVFSANHVPGGSSSGSACAVAAGIVRFSLGTDTAGSGRVPAAFGNIVGLKPTLGSISTRGVVPACRSLDTISVFAPTVDEALAVQRVIAAFDGDDPYSRAAPFAYLRRGAAPPAPRIATQDTVDISIFLEIARLLYDGPWVAERTAGLRDVVMERPDILHPVTRAILQAGLDRRTVDAFDAFHRLAEARRVAATLFRDYDALVLPTTPFCPTLAEVADDPIGVNSRLGTYTNFVNLCDLAAVAVPTGFDSNGLPHGVTLIGPAWSEGRLAALADAIHRRGTDLVGATGIPLTPPALPDALAANETALFCIGAHMSGLPLNHQLTELGGRFVGAARTEPAYRLFALGNRPGMVRSGDGAVIEGEIWALPTVAIGTLLARVPPPLGFGTVQLRDGPCLGFLAEAGGIGDARDITSLGGWRGWLAEQAA